MSTNLFHTTLSRLERSLTCDLIASDIDLEHGLFSKDSPTEDILAYALENRFSRIPLHDPTLPRIVTHVAEVDLQGKRLQSTHIIATTDLISSDTPISQIIPILRDRVYCFVLVQDSVKKILTRSDLNKLPVRIYLNMLVAHLEGLLANAIDSAYPNDEWASLLSDARQCEVRKLFADKTRDEFDTRLIDCTTLSDKATIIGKASEVLEKIHDGSKKQYERRYELIRLIRNRIDHGLPPLTEENDRLRDHLLHGQQITKAKDVNWLAGVVDVMELWINRLTASR